MDLKTNCDLVFQTLRLCAFAGDSPNPKREFSRKDAKYAKVRPSEKEFTSRAWRPFDVAQGMLGGRYFRIRLCGEINLEEFNDDNST